MISREPTPVPSTPRLTATQLAGRAAGIVVARARFLLLVGAVLLLMGYWDTLRNYWDKLTRPGPTGGGVSADTEYWCPMCPGVISDWPTKCPVCNMTLIRRKKGEMTPLPDGVVARVQLSPYRIQLAGIQTSAVTHRRLEHEVIVSGLLEAAPGLPASSADPFRLILKGEVFERDALLLNDRHEAEVTCDALPGERFAGRLAELTPQPISGVRGVRVRVQVEDPRRELRPGLFAAASFRVAVARTDGYQRLALERWRDRTAVSGPAGALAALLDAGVAQALRHAGLTLAVPESAVIDTGTRKLVYLEQMRGMFDAVEVQLGRRCGDFYPVRSGLEAGQRVVTVGTVLLDAETRLNPSVAASYFGAGTRPSGSSPAASSPLSPEDLLLVKRQKTCPVTNAALGSMGVPLRLVVNGRVVFICCDGCEYALRESPDEYLRKLPK